MFNSSDLYGLFKPAENPTLITNYSVVIGGTILPADMEKGAIVLHAISSKPVSSQFKDFDGNRLIEPDPDIEGDKYKIYEYSALELTYQCDIYKVNDLNATEIQAEIEAHKIREWLNGMESTIYLENKEAQILPIYSPLRFTNELLSNQHLVNRVSFDFSILATYKIKEWVDVVEKIVVEKTLIL